MKGGEASDQLKRPGNDVLQWTLCTSMEGVMCVVISTPLCSTLIGVVAGKFSFFLSASTLPSLAVSLPWLVLWCNGVNDTVRSSCPSKSPQAVIIRVDLLFALQCSTPHGQNPVSIVTR